VFPLLKAFALPFFVSHPDSNTFGASCAARGAGCKSQQIVFLSPRRLLLVHNIQRQHTLESPRVCRTENLVPVAALELVALSAGNSRLCGSRGEEDGEPLNYFERVLSMSAVVSGLALDGLWKARSHLRCHQAKRGRQAASKYPVDAPSPPPLAVAATAQAAGALHSKHRVPSQAAEQPR
jgi:hypothetical protein